MKNNLVNVNENNTDVIIELRYASKNNFTNQKIFKSNECLIHKIAFEYLCKAVEISRKLGFKLKIFDAYRPVYVQKHCGINYQTQILLHLLIRVHPTQEVLQLT